MAVNDVYRASFLFDFPGSDGEMVFTMHYRTTNVFNVISGQAEAQEIAEAAKTEVESSYLALVSDEYTFQSVNVIGVSDPTVGLVDVSGQNGVILADTLPLRTAPVVKLATGLRGRSFNGRMYLLAPGEDQQDGGTMVGTYIAALESFVNDLINLTGATSTNTYEGTIYSKKLSDENNVVLDNLITSVNVNPVFGSLRSRQSV